MLIFLPWAGVELIPFSQWRRVPGLEAAAGAIPTPRDRMPAVREPIGMRAGSQAG